MISLYILTSWGLIPIGNIASGWVAERTSPTAALVAGSVLTFVAAIVVAVAYPTLRRLASGSAAVVSTPAR